MYLISHQEDKDTDTKEEFYNILDRECECIPKYDLKLVLEHSNAKIEKKAIYRPLIGNYYKNDETNKTGRFLID